MKELRALTQLDLGGLLLEYMWISMAVILKKDAVSLGYTLSSIII
ncbi:hypothetical protein [Acetivibrio clariflavus]|nr:hypothetical protein [Acetivibrio clariflavus]